MKTIFSFLMLMIILTGCAVTRDQVSIQYEPMTDVAKIEKAETIPFNVQVTDSRTSKDRVGRKKNGYGMDCSSIVCENDMNQLIKEAISQELHNRGFVLSLEDCSSTLVKVNLHKFYNDFKLGYFTGKGMSEIILQVDILKPDHQLSFSKTVVGTGVNRNVMMFSGKNAKIALEEALKNAISELMEDSSFIQALLNLSQ